MTKKDSIVHKIDNTNMHVLGRKRGYSHRYLRLGRCLELSALCHTRGEGTQGGCKITTHPHLTIGEAMHIVKRSAWTPFSDPHESISFLQQFTSLTYFASRESTKNEICTSHCAAKLFIFNTRWWSTLYGLAITSPVAASSFEPQRGMFVCRQRRLTRK